MRPQLIFLLFRFFAGLVLLSSAARAESPCDCESSETQLRPIFAGVATGCDCPEPVVKSSEKIEIELPATLDDSLNIPMTKGQSHYVLELEKYNCRGENFRVVAAGADGQLEEIEAPPVCTYRGSILGDPASSVVGSITAAGASLRVTCGDGECWEIHRSGEDYELRTVSVREQLAEMLMAVESGAISESLFGAMALPRAVTVKQAEIGFDIDFPTWSRPANDRTGFGRSDAAVVAKMEEFVAVKLNSFIISNALIEHVVGTIVIRKSAADDPYDGMTDSGAILSRMRSVWNGETAFPRPSTTHDLASALIGRGIGVNGLGYVGTINEGSRYNISTTINGSGVGFWFNGIGKHECGHNWGLNHGGCGDEKRPQGDDFTWSMCGGFHDRMRSDEASRVLSERDSSNLVDIGPYTASDQAPYCPKDTATVSIGGGPVQLDVQRNDYDANNSPFEIERLTIGTVETATTELGGNIVVSEGTGPDGRDEVTYTPPATGTPGSVDKFYYHVRDTTGKGSFGQVKVTLQPSSKPKEVNLGSFIADTAIDFSNEQNPTIELSSIDPDGNDIFRDVWSYGSFNNGSTTLSLATASQSDSATVVGDENEGWIGSDAVRIHKLAMLPTDNHDAVKRWNSDYDGEIAVLYDVKRVETGGNGCLASIRLNGTVVWSDTLNDADPHAAGTVLFDVASGDDIDFVLDSLGSRSGDWTHFTGRIVPAQQVKWQTQGGPTIHYKLDAAGTYPIERRRAVADYSGNKNHATLTGFDVNNARFAAEIENGLIFDGSDDEIITPQPASLQGATELTLSAWVHPETLGDNIGILTSLNDTDQNTSYFGFLIAPVDGGHQAQFRAHRGPVNAGSNLPTGRWSHLVGVWKAGEIQKLYVDGVEVADNASPPSGGFDTDHWIIGRDRTQANRWFDGSLDDVAIWERALEASEVAAMYAQGRYSMSYDGVADFEQSSSPLYANGSEEITMSAWVRADSLGDNRGIITSFNGEDFDGDPFERSYFALLIGSTDDGRPAQFRAHRFLINALPGSFPIGEWAHIVGVWRAGVEQSLYIDGVRVAFDDDPVDKSIDIDAWITGRDRLNAGRFFDGEIGDHFILSRALDAGEVAEVYAEGRTNYPATEGEFTHGGQIGSQSGTFEEASGVITTSTRGNIIGGTSDSFLFASCEHGGDGEVIVKVESLTDAGGGGKTGLMFREGRAANAAFVGLWQYGDGRLSMRTRASTGAVAVTETTLTHPPTFPLWLRFGRRGDDFIGSYSADGEEWQQLAIADVVLDEMLEVGIAHEANATSFRSIATWSQFGISDSVSLSPDTDSDGLDDAWEQQFFGNLAQDGSGDPDEDGISNLFERYHGSNPTLPDAAALQPQIVSYTGDLVDYGSVWRFLDDGSDGGSWNVAGFDDSSWSSGPAPLGYPANDVTTLVDFGGNSLNRHVTTFFRHRFNVADPSSLSSPTLFVVRDDGVAVYLNGNELGRDNLAAGATHTTLADRSLGGAEESEPIAIPISISDLMPGVNTLAAEVHQALRNSSDLSFDLELQAQLDPSVTAGEFLSIRFERSKALVATVIATAEGSSDLLNWIPLSTTPRIILDNGETETLEITDDQSFSTNTHRYLRLRLSVDTQ